jgi:cGMP-dependent protein kinase
MYVVERGVVVVTDANDRVVARAKDGDVVGERSLMGSERRALRATVDVDANAPA